MKYQIKYERCIIDLQGKVRWKTETSTYGIKVTLHTLRTLRWSANRYGYNFRLIRKSKGVWVEVENIKGGIASIFRTITLTPIEE